MNQSIDRATARQAIAWLDRIDRAGRLQDLRDALDFARRQWREERNNRTIGESLRFGELADIAARLLGIDRELCNTAATDLAGWTQVALEVIRAEAERLNPRPIATAKPQRRRRGVA
jgi:hypothetical protein